MHRHQNHAIIYAHIYMNVTVQQHFRNKQND